MQSHDTGLLKRGVGIAVAVLMMLGLKFYNKSQSSTAVKERIHEIVATLPHYSSEQPYIDSLFDKAHERGFEAAYSSGSKRRRARFDTSKYIQVVFNTMIEDAKLEGRGELANEIQARESLLLNIADDQRS